MELITQAGDPTLWATLNSKWTTQDSPGWVVNDNVHYKISFDTTGLVQFSSHTTLELVDSRSPMKSKDSSYHNLDRDE